MGHLTANERWGNVDLDTTTGRVFVQQDWHYHWILYLGVSAPWTLAEKRRFHHSADLWLWRIWSNHLRLKVSGETPFHARSVPVNFDIRWKLHGSAHWQVMANKVPPNATATDPVRSMVQWDLRTITLSSADTGPRGAGNDAGRSTSNFVTVPHEFGHSIGYLFDEYNASTAALPNPYLTDTSSLMNIGREVRARHLKLLIATLNRLMPSAHFEA